MAFLEPKQRRFIVAIIFFLNSACTKTTLFWTTRVQNGIVLNQLSHIQNNVVWVSDSLFKTTSFWFLIQNDVVSPRFKGGGGGGGGGGAVLGFQSHLMLEQATEVGD